MPRKRSTRTTRCATCGRKGRTERADGAYRCRICDPRSHLDALEPIELTGGRWVPIAGIHRWIPDTRQEAA